MAWLRRHFDALSWVVIGLLIITLIVVESAKSSAAEPSVRSASRSDTGAEWLPSPLNPLNPLSPMNPTSPVSGGR